ncbi:HAMP domain-containing sensor histidine kinase [Lachnoanaerobaculum saburreum]|uniref:histidine kinase n=1 Tax=Lachnoanaerobaculum saburreum DSM 3986 TaxID=887325 RepID=E6LNG2_9FIRM|nr:HAMP domain-containing sensor histidine kinase [Lachnoanaerobaculum saburreum]EFU76659.1 ATPase/histidine kinase/DNA gyrase B/HSP90 domain protein [Lachnoanaerobaculum saburreum DSM 3986]
MKDRSLVKSFRRTFVMILISGILATLITYIIAILLYFGIQNIGKYPENFYEKQIPKIEAYIHEKNTDLLYVRGESGLNNIIRGNGIMYQVLNSDCEVLYGTYKERVFADTDKLIDKINTTFVLKGRFAYIVPIGNGTKIEGAVILLYKLGNPYKNIRIIIAVIAMLSPFLYFIIFTRLFSTSLVKKINFPLQLLIEASQKIKEKDLDFEVNYQSDNELGKLCTAFMEMKDELKKSLFSQWKAEQERIEMIEALAHDLKTPLSVIMAYSEALTEADLTDDEKLKTYLNVINGNAKKSSNLVMQMQYTSDLENANTNSVLRNVNLTEFLKKKISQYRFQAKQKEIDIVLNINSDLGYVMSDTDRLERILDNIFSNSLQYTPHKGSIKFFVNKENNKIVYEICDTGSGFTQKDMDKAFDRFYRGDKARSSEGGHLGLGLYIVKKLVEQLHGSVIIKNTELKGADIIFWHPV